MSGTGEAWVQSQTQVLPTTTGKEQTAPTHLSVGAATFNAMTVGGSIRLYYSQQDYNIGTVTLSSAERFSYVTLKSNVFC